MSVRLRIGPKGGTRVTLDGLPQKDGNIALTKCPGEVVWRDRNRRGRRLDRWTTVYGPSIYPYIDSRLSRGNTR